MAGGSVGFRPAEKIRIQNPVGCEQISRWRRERDRGTEGQKQRGTETEAAIDIAIAIDRDRDRLREGVNILSTKAIQRLTMHPLEETLTNVPWSKVLHQVQVAAMTRINNLCKRGQYLCNHEQQFGFRLHKSEEKEQEQEQEEGGWKRGWEGGWEGGWLGEGQCTASRGSMQTKRSVKSPRVEFAPSRSVSPSQALRNTFGYASRGEGTNVSPAPAPPSPLLPRQNT